MEKQDITEYTDQELSLICYNDEPLYKAMRRTHGFESKVREIVDELFVYTIEQFDDLVQTIVDDLAEDAA